VEYPMRTSLRCIVLAALVLTSVVLASCAPKPAPAPAAAPAARAPAAPTSAPPLTTAPAAPGSAQTVIVEKPVEKAAPKPATVVVTTPTPPGQPTPENGASTDWDRIRAAGRIIVGVSPQYRPFAYYNADSRLDGFDVAVVREIGRRLGLETIARDVAPAALMSALGSRQIDLALPSPDGTVEGEPVADFTKPFHICRDVILAGERTGVGEVRRPADLAGRAIGVLSGSRHEAWLQKTLVEPGQMAATGLFTYTLVSQLVGALHSGQIELAIVDAVQATPLLKQGGVRSVGQDLNRQNRRLAVPKGSQQLRSEVDRALAEIARDGTLARLSGEYLGLEPADLLRLTEVPPEKVATPAPSPTPTNEPPAGSFAAEPIHIAPGDCTRFTWSIENVREIYFYVRGERWERSPATGMESRRVCPAATTTYELRIVDADGATEVRSITILVDEHPQMPVSSRLSTNPLSFVQLGECLTLSWEVHGNHVRVQIVRDQTVLWSDAPAAGSLQDCPPAAGTVIYSAVASAPGQTIQTQRVITVNP
jgi:ABC-type amino acid transport substrate-binding protein